MTRILRFASLVLAAVLALPALAAPAVKTASVSPDVAILARTQPLRHETALGVGGSSSTGAVMPSAASTRRTPRTPASTAQSSMRQASPAS